MSAQSDNGWGRRILRVVLWTLGILFVLVLALPIVSIASFLVEIPFRFVCGWVFHGWKSLPPFLGKWESALLPAGCLVMAGVLLHRIILRWAKEKRPSLEWRAGHTLAGLSLLLLVSAAAIATSGIFHQFFWLAGGKVIESNRRADLTMAVSNGRQLMLCLLEYEVEKDRYPRSFVELEEFEGFEEQKETIRRLWWLDTRDGNVPEPWILLRPGSAETALAEDPVIVSPVIRSREKVAVVFGDSSVRSMTLKMFEDLMKTQARGNETR